MAMTLKEIYSLGKAEPARTQNSRIEYEQAEFSINSDASEKIRFSAFYLADNRSTTLEVMRQKGKDIYCEHYIVKKGKFSHKEQSIGSEALKPEHFNYLASFNAEQVSTPNLKKDLQEILVTLRPSRI